MKTYTMSHKTLLIKAHRARGEGYKDPEMYDASNTLEIVLDAKTGKAKSVKFRAFSASVKTKGKWEKTQN